MHTLLCTHIIIAGVGSTPANEMRTHDAHMEKKKKAKKIKKNSCDDLTHWECWVFAGANHIVIVQFPTHRSTAVVRLERDWVRARTRLCCGLRGGGGTRAVLEATAFALRHLHRPVVCSAQHAASAAVRARALGGQGARVCNTAPPSCTVSLRVCMGAGAAHRPPETRADTALAALERLGRRL